MEGAVTKVFANPDNFFSISEKNVTTPAQEVRQIVDDIVGAHRLQGSDRAIFIASQMLGLSQSRVTQILRGKIGRVWADEWVECKRRYIAHCDQQEAALQQRAKLVRARREAIQGKMNAGMSALDSAGSVVARRGQYGDW